MNTIISNNIVVKIRSTNIMELVNNTLSNKTTFLIPNVLLLRKYSTAVYHSWSCHSFGISNDWENGKHSLSHNLA